MTGLQAQTLAAAEARLSAAGFGPDMAEAVCEQAAIDHPGYDQIWAEAVAGDVEAMCDDPEFFEAVQMCRLCGMRWLRNSTTYEERHWSGCPAAGNRSA